MLPFAKAKREAHRTPINAKIDDDDEGEESLVRTDFELLLQTFEEVYREDLKFVTEFLSGKSIYQATDTGDTILPPLTPDCFGFCKDMRSWIEDDFGPFAQFIYFIIFLMVITLAVDGYDADSEVKSACRIMNVIYIAIFMELHETNLYAHLIT